MTVNIRLIYLYLFSFVGLLIAVIGTVRLVDLGLKVYVFKGADNVSYYMPPMPATEGKFAPPTPGEDAKQRQFQVEETNRQRQREVSTSLAMIVVGVPLYLYHWSVIQKENRD